MAEPRTEPIAIVGMGCRTPGGVGSLDEFWDLLRMGRDTVSAVPEDRWADYSASPLLRDTVRYGSFLDDIKGFDAEFFGILPREAELMDPQQRILLEVAWEALEHAGIPPATLAGTDTAVYIGVVSDDYERRLMEDLAGIEAWTGICTQMCGLANRISYALDLRGASLALDTACSASLVAVHLACRALAAGEAPVAIVGGINVVAGPGLTVMLDAAGALSPDGRCKSFDTTADGYGRGEGAAVVVLKRLSDAQRDGDVVHAVIRGTAVHQDGRTNGIMAPSEAAQAHLLRSAYRGADIQPSTVDYVEAHGTGTPVGDPMEVGALAAVIGAGREAGAPCLIGSLKTNIGHLEGAAGVIGMIKAVQAITRAEIPATLIATELTSEIPWSSTGLRVVTETTPWPAGEHPRRAGVSGYGYGGTLAHVILEQAPPVAETPLSDDDRDRWVFPISGATPAGLRANAAVLADRLAADGAPSLRAVGHTLGIRREHLSSRAAIVAGSRDDLVQRLRSVADEEHVGGMETGSPLAAAAAGPVWVFSGHGSQWVGMGRGLLAAEPAFGAVLDEIGPVFQAEIGFTPREVLLGDRLDAVDVIQPMIFAVQVGLAAVWRGYGVEPAAVIGHSVGEVAAAVTAGALSLRGGARLICRRSVLLRKVAGKGAMAMVNLPFSLVAEQLGTRHDVVAAISASPMWTVVSGDIPSVESVVDGWLANGLAVRRVDSDVAFHSPQMDPLLDDLAAADHDLTAMTPKIPIYPTALEDPRATPVHDGSYWAANLRNPVRFAEAVRAAAEDGHRVFLEVSGHPVVAHSIDDALADVPDTFVTGTLRRNTPDHETLLTNLGALHCHGVPVDFTVLFPRRELVDLPTTSWRHRPFWRANSPLAGLASVGHDVESHTLLGGRTAVAGTTPLRLWQTRLDYASRPYPGNHPVHGVEIVPAAVLLHTFAVAVGDGHDLTDVDLRAPISLSRPRELQVTLQDGALRLASRLLGDDDDAAWLTHTTSVVESTSGSTSRLDVAASGALVERLAQRHVHDLLASLDVPAMGFPWQVESLRRDAGQLFATVSGTGWASLFDAALSLPTAVFPGEPTLRMPAHIDRMAVRAGAPSRAVVHVRLVEDSTVDVVIADPDGTVLAEFGGMRFAVPDGASEEETPAGPAVVGTRWTGLPPEDLHDVLLTEVRGQVAYETRLPVAEVNVRMPLAEMGLDSVMTLHIRRRLEQMFGVSLPTTLLWNHPSVTAIAGYLADELLPVGVA